MTLVRGTLVVCLFTAWPAARALQQPVVQRGRVAPPAPCSGDSVDTRVRRDNVVVVPNVDGMSLLRAKLALAKVRLEIDERRVLMEGPVGVVIAQSPQPGSSASTGDVVIVCTRTARRVPSVVGLTVDVARRNLRDSGYEVVTTNSFVTRESQVGIVVRQQPAAGAPLSLGAVDTIVIGIASPIVTTPPSQSVLQANPDSQTPDSGTAKRFANDAPIIAFGEPTDRMRVWKWVLAIGLLVIVVATVVRARLRRGLTGFRVTPHKHPGNPRVVVVSHDGEAKR